MPLFPDNQPASTTPAANPLRDVVEGDGQHQHGGPFQPSIAGNRLRISSTQRSISFASRKPVSVR